MYDGLLSQEEIDALLGNVSKPSPLSDSDKDLLGEVGNIAMGSASTALSTILGKMVNITTPKVSITSINKIKERFEVPIVSLEVLYTENLKGANLLLIKLTDAAVIADIMMGGSGENTGSTLSEIEISAVSEAMNQMIGSAATSLSTMLNLPVNISPPTARIWDDNSKTLSDNVDPDEDIVEIAFRLTIENLLDSQIMLLLSIETARSIVDKMTGGASDEAAINGGEHKATNNSAPNDKNYEIEEEEIKIEPQVNVQKAKFAPLTPLSNHEKQNIDLILDVPLEISVVLGRSKKTIKEILEMGPGSLVELDKLTEEPVEILVNGKKVALGEVVVIDENFGVRITSIISNADRVKSLQGK
ncbi:flagellar motor switch phosphatase FliY [Caloramator sp. E03]|uniref:flagellar motor switch phosphatase FliY n=1 Tax=Caloramator sp. E03 TaxID=2576307 RepID=UPI00143CFEB2|nr:flagellar motor switch phosphatase FliY [Caloramator sp. E03]